MRKISVPPAPKTPKTHPHNIAAMSERVVRLAVVENSAVNVSSQKDDLGSMPDL